MQKYEQKHPLEHYYTHKYRERGRYRERVIYLLSQMAQPLEREGRPSSYRKSNSKLPREAKLKDKIPLYTCMEGRVCAHQLACIMPEKGKEKASARKRGRLTKYNADQPIHLVGGKKSRPVASCHGRWVEGMADKPPSSLRSQKHKCLVYNQAQNKQVERS